MVDTKSSEALDTTSLAHLNIDIEHDFAVKNSLDEPEKPKDANVVDIERGSAIEQSLDEPGGPKDPNVVDFEGPDDPDNAMNWSERKKFLNIMVVSLITLLSIVKIQFFNQNSRLTTLVRRPIASTISSAGSYDIRAYFHSTNQSLGAFVTTVFLLGYTFGPIVLALLSEICGRSILYKICIT